MFLFMIYMLHHPFVSGKKGILKDDEDDYGLLYRDDSSSDDEAPKGMQAKTRVNRKQWHEDPALRKVLDAVNAQ